MEQTSQDSQVIVMEEVKEENAATAQYTGQCKWFNNSYGYGFLTVCDGPDKGADIFVHWEGIKPLNSLYKTLKKGEYVIFDVIDSDKGKQAVNVRGICGGPLLCDHIQVKKSLHTGVPHPPHFVNVPPPPPAPYASNGWTSVQVNRRPNGVYVGAKRTRYGRFVDTV
jgi:CspA family cold shock protein